MIKKQYLVQVRMGDKDIAILDTLGEEVYGGAGRADVIRRVLTERFNKAFPPYLREKKKGKLVEIPEEELTPEQACEAAGGKVETVEGVKMCVFKMSASMESHVPLTKPELFKKYKK